MKILVESHIPYIKGVLEPYFDRVVYVPSVDISPEKLADVDALMVRTHTQCNERLLGESPVRFLATGTIGMDHIDQDYCRRRGISFHNAPGCNAPAVAQWVMAAITTFYPDTPLGDLTLGVVGVGHIGTIVDRWARSLGMKTLLCDPPRAERGEAGFVELGEIAERADIVTFHTPLTRQGRHATFHLCGREFVKSLRRAPAILNASRGAVADTRALIEGLDSGKISRAAIDVWEGEPQLPVELLERVQIGTPHIAGYSEAGKIRATAMIVKALADWMGIDAPSLPVKLPADAPLNISRDMINYDIMADDAYLRSAPTELERLRDEYKLREEVKTAKR